MKNILIALSIVAVLAALVVGVLWWMGLPPFTKPASTPAPVSTSPTPEPVASPAQATDTESPAVEIANFSFQPATVTVKKGTSVTWTNKDVIGHNAASDDNSWKIAILSTGQSASVTFDKPGTFGYHCTPHPFMKGTIVVTD